jgi:endonuclease YncB( thermonuclease family)
MRSGFEVKRPLVIFFLTTFATCGGAYADPCTAALPRKGVSFSGIVRYIVDGDGLCVGKTTNPDEWIEVRLQDFYAPELREKGGLAAKLALNKIAMGKPVSCIADHRSYDRIVARCTVQGFSIGDVMRRAGVKEGGNGWQPR